MSSPFETSFTVANANVATQPIDAGSADAAPGIADTAGGSDTLPVTVIDGVDIQQATVSPALKVTTVPSVAVGGPYSGSENTTFALPDVTVGASPNSGDPLSAVLSVAHGTLTAGVQMPTDPSGASITLTGTAAQIDSELASLSYAGNVNFYGSDTLSVTVTDTADNQTAAASAAINVADVTAPSAAAGGPYGGSENTTFALPGVTVGASPNSDDPLSAVLSVAHGTLTAGVQMPTDPSGATITLTGTAAQIDSELASLSYAGNANFYGSDTLSVTVIDTADNQTAAASATINVADVTAPSVAAGGPYGGSENTTFALPDVTVAASPNSDDPLSAVLSVQNGTLTAGVQAFFAALDVQDITLAGGQGGSSLTLTGTAAQIDSALAGLSYAGNANFYGSDTLSVTVTDSVDNQTATDSATINVADVTVPSVAAGGAYSGSENTTFALPGVTVGASPNSDDPLSAVLSVQNGTLTAGGQAFFAALDVQDITLAGGQGGSSLTLTGTAAQIDSALAGLSYAGNANFYGSDTLSVTVTDSVDNQTATDSATINVADVTVPSVAAGGPYSGSENTTFALPNVTVAASPNCDDPLSEVLSVAHGTLTAGVQMPTDPSGASITLTGTAAQIDSELASLSYAGNANFYGSDTLSVTVTDTVDNQQAAASAAINVADVTVPSVAAGSAYSGSENSKFALAGVKVGASPNQSDPLSVTLSVQHGLLYAGGPEASTITLTGTAAVIDKQLATLIYIGSSNYYGSDTLSVKATDTKDNQTASASATIKIADTSVPSVAAGGPYLGGKNAAIALTGVTVSVSPNTTDPLSAVLSVQDGSLTAGGQTGASITLTGTAAQIDAALAGLSYTGNLNSSGSDTLSVTATDTADNRQATATAAITLDPGPTAGNAHLYIAPSQSLNLTGALLALDSPGLPGDTLSLTGAGTTGTKGTVTFTGGQLTYKAPAGGSADSFTYAVSDQLGDNATGTVGVTLDPKLSGNYNITITGGAGSDNIIDGGNGNDQVSVTGSNNTVLLGNGNDQVSLTGNSNVLMLGNGNDNVTLSGNSSTTVLGNGNENVSLTGSSASLTLGTGNDSVTMSGNMDTVVFGTGNGNDNLTLSGNGDTAVLSNGNQNVGLSGSNDSVTLGNGNDNVTMTGTGTGDSITAGTGNDNFTLGGNSVTLRLHGSHDTVSLNGGTDTIADTVGGTDNLSLQLGTNGGTISVANFSIAHGVLQLAQALASAEGWTNPGQIDAALTTDGSGGSLLSLGSHGSVDFQGIAKSSLTASNFQIH